MRKRVLHFGLSSNHGGIETYAENIVNVMDTKDYGFVFVSESPNGLANEVSLLEAGATVYPVSPRRKSYVKHLRDLIVLLRSYDRKDVVEFHLMTYSWFEPIVLATFLFKGTIILHAHATSEGDSGIKTRLLSRVGRCVVSLFKKRYRLIACGTDAGLAFFGKSLFSVVKNGIDIEAYEYNHSIRAEVRSEIGLSMEENVLIHVGRFDAVKNHLQLIDIFREYQKLKNSSILLLVGDGDLRRDITQRIKDYGLEEKVILMGRRKDVMRLYSAADALVMPSLHEGLPFTLIEAQANGLRCTVSSGIDREANITGLVKFVGLDRSAEYWADKINSDRSVSSAQKLHSTDYNVKNMTQKLHEIYN